jgi:hypothetical protein
MYIFYYLLTDNSEHWLVVGAEYGIVTPEGKKGNNVPVLN